MTKQQAIKLIEKNTGMKVVDWDYCRATKHFSCTTSTAHAGCGYLMTLPDGSKMFKDRVGWEGFSHEHMVEWITLDCVKFMSIWKK